MELRVFVVEDVPAVVENVAGLLSAMGGMRLVGKAGSETEANAWLDSNPGGWDVAVIDLVLDQGTGLGVIRHARTVHAAGAVAVLSAFLNRRVRAHCQKLGVDAVFSKTEFDALAHWLHARGSGPGTSL
jgi:DNA-binding NarL/FixJ family response regulator